jgi:ribosomal protein S7
MLKITPDLILYPLKLGGVLQRVPMPICERKQYTFAVKWVIKLLRDKYGSVTTNNVAEALISAIYGKGLSIEKKMSVYEVSTSNRHLTKFFKFR